MSEEAAPRVHVRTPETDEVQRRIGRNLVAFQQVEHLLKYLNTHAAFIGPASELSAGLEKQAASMHQKTMGELAGRLIDNVLKPPASDEPADEIDEGWMGLRIEIEADAEYVDRTNHEIRALVKARNELVHHFLPRWISAANGEADSALKYLDAQWDETLRLKKRLAAWARAVEAGQRRFAEFLASPEGEHVFEQAHFRASRLSVMLGDIAKRTARADGWAVLAQAANVIAHEAPEELKDLRERFGHSRLKAVMLATGLFDVVDEPTPRGGVRTIYRTHAQYDLQNGQEPPTLGMNAAGM